MARELFEVEGTGVAQYLHFDADGNLQAMEWQEDVEAVIEANKVRKVDGSNGWGATREWRHIADVPHGLFLKFATERCGQSPEALRFINSQEGFAEIVLKMLKDPDYRAFRTDI